MGLPYDAHKIDISKNVQFEVSFVYFPFFLCTAQLVHPTRPSFPLCSSTPRGLLDLISLFQEWYIKEVNPNSKIPAIIDKEASGGPLSIFESGAILIYLAKKSGKFLPQDPRKEAATLSWLMWQMGGLGPMTGQMGHFFRYAKEDIPYAKERYQTETKRLFLVLEKQLEGREYVIGDVCISSPYLQLFFTFLVAHHSLFPYLGVHHC